jgi:hypothetical protein
MGAFEQNDAKPSLEVFDAAAEGGLGDGTVFRRLAEMTSFGQGAKKAQLLEAGQGNQGGRRGWRGLTRCGKGCAVWTGGA